MAGSWNHLVNEYDGLFTMDLIENLGDAHEALEECFGIIVVLATEASVRGYAAGEPVEVSEVIHSARMRYREGLARGARDDDL